MILIGGKTRQPPLETWKIAMSDPKKPANDNIEQKTTSPEVVDTRTVAEKDNTTLHPKPPSNLRITTPSLSPTGSVPVSTKSQNEKPDASLTAQDIVFEPYDPSEHPINLSTDDITLDEQINEYRVLTKVDDLPNENGIDGGRISRLAFVIDGDAEVYFDYGEWIRPPKTPLEHRMVDDIKDDLNATPEKDYSGFATPETDNDPEL